MAPLAGLWTPTGRGAIATIRVSEVERFDARGAGAVLDSVPFRAANGRPLSCQPIGRIVFGQWGTEPAEDVVLCAVDRQSLEIHCHGGRRAAERILRDLAGAGCQIVDWPDMLAREKSPLHAELIGELCRTTTLRTSAMLWEQTNGVFESAIAALQSLATSDPATAGSRIRESLTWTDFGLHLTQPWSVVLAGRPNVGKSSLINAILGYTRSVVFDQPGTTRDVVCASTAVDGWPIELTDTAGLRESADSLETAGIERARKALEAADLPIILIDISQAASPTDRALISQYPGGLVVAHKCDLAAYDGQGKWEAHESSAWHRVSSKTGEGLETLVAAVARRLVPHAPPPDALIPVTERQASRLQSALDASERGDAVGLQRALDELVAAPKACSKVDYRPSANRKGSPPTS
jgi:tRNA modification GTPase